MKKIIKNNDKPLLKSLRHISLINYYVQGLDYETFSKDLRTVDACITKITQLGEMVSRVDDDFKNDHNEIPWREIKGLRNIVVHNYDSVDYQSLWETIKEDISELERMYTDILLNCYEYKTKDFAVEISDISYLPYLTSKLTEKHTDISERYLEIEKEEMEM